MKHNKRYYVFMVLCLLLTLVISGCSKIVNDNTIEHIDNEKSQKLTITNMTDMMSQEMMNNVRQNYLNNIDNEFKVDDNSKIDVIVKTGNNSVAEMFLNQKKIKTLSDYIASENGQALIASMGNKQTEVKNRIAEAEIEIEYSRNFTTLLNGFGATISKKDIAILKAIEGVESVIISETYNAPASTNGLFDSMQDTGIFKNESKYKGEGMLIAVIDTGLDYNHSAFKKELSKVNYTEEQMNSVIKEAALEGRYYSSKVAYMYDYADKDNDVYPNEDHGTHVAGIAAGDNDVIQGVAPSAQLAIMKVFPDDGQTGSKTIDILAALSDCAVLGTDIINMSLGSNCGFTEQFGEEGTIINSTYNIIEKLGITICAAAGNSYYSSIVSNYRGSLSTNPDASVVSSPSSYNASFSVAASNTAPIYYIVANSEHGMMYNNAANTEGKSYDFTALLGSEDDIKLEYVLIPGIGSKGDYSGYDVNGKIAVVNRGEISFEDKQKIAAENGAVACIVCNNEQGEINMQIENLVIPSCSVNLDNGKYFKANPNGYIEMGNSIYTGPDMAAFSSWGPTSSGLHIKPEITAPGNDIFSASIGEKYAVYGGTSMASPNMAGLMAVVRQYIRDKFPTMSEIELYDMAYQLVMSTADTVNDKYGIPNAVRKQGAGMANLNSVLNTNAYLTVTGSNRTKIELGSDKKQTGIYTLNFNVVNFGTEAVSYNLDTITLTETVIDNIIRNSAKILYDNEIEVSVRNGEYNDGIVTVAGNSTARVSVTITLTTENKNYIKSTFKNGMYVEGFVKLNNTDKNGVSLSIPWLAFFGDYDALPVFQPDIYGDELAQNYNTTPISLYLDKYLIPLGMYPYNTPEGYEAPAPDKNRIALSDIDNTLNNIYSVFTGLYRNIDRLDYELVDAISQTPIWTGYANNVIKTYFDVNINNIRPLQHELDLAISDFEIANNQVLEFRMIASFYDNDYTFTYSFPIYIDKEAPILLNGEIVEKDNKTILKVDCFDNRYLCDMQLFTIEDFGYNQLTTTVIPLISDVWGENIHIEYDITDLLDSIKGKKLYVTIEDYALNSSIYEFTFTDEEGGETISDFVTDEKGILISYTGKDKNIVIPEFVTGIATEIFNSNKTIESVDMSLSKIVTIAPNAFENCSVLKSVKFSNALEEIGTSAFANCVLLDKITLPASVKKINNAAFLNCCNLYAVDIPGANKIDIGWSVFAMSLNAKLYVSGETFEYYTKLVQLSGKVTIFNFNDYEIKDNTLIKYKGESKDINFPACIEKIGDNAFKDNAQITSVSIVNIIAIGNNAFKNCNAIEQIIIPQSVKNIGDYAFSGCKALKTAEIISEIPPVIGKNIFDNTSLDMKIIIPIGCGEEYSKLTFSSNAKPVIEEKEFYEINNGTLISYIGNPEILIIPDGVTVISDGIFAGKESIKEVKLPEKLEKIGENAFNGCINLSAINIPDTIYAIGKGAFVDCISLKEIKLTEDMSELYDGTFTNSGIVKLVIPENISVIYPNALSNMPALEELRINAKIIDILGMRMGVRIDYISNNNPALKKLTLNGEYIYIGYETIDGFTGCDALSEIVINGNATSIGGNIFSDLSSLEKVVINGNIDEIKDNAFNNNKKLNCFEINGLVNSIGNGVFNGSLSLRNYTIGENSLYYSMDEYGVLYNKDMTRIYRQPEGWDYSGTYVMPNSVADIDAYAFSSNDRSNEKTQLTAIKISDSLTYIAEHAFENCINLNSISYSNEIGFEKYAFRNTGFEVIDITDKILYLDYGAFAESKVKTINISKDAVLFSFSDVFFNCNEFMTINAEEGNKAVKIADGIVYNPDMTVLYRYNYDGSRTDSEFIVPDTVRKIGSGAFINNKELRKITIPMGVAAIGHKAFFATENLTEYHFLGIEAPRLEGLYEVGYEYPYANFYDYMEALDRKLTIYHPENGQHYDNIIWSSFFTEKVVTNTDENNSSEDSNIINNYTVIIDFKRYI